MQEEKPEKLEDEDGSTDDAKKKKKKSKKPADDSEGAESGSGEKMDMDTLCKSIAHLSAAAPSTSTVVDLSSQRSKSSESGAEHAFWGTQPMRKPDGTDLRVKICQIFFRHCRTKRLRPIFEANAIKYIQSDLSYLSAERPECGGPIEGPDKVVRQEPFNLPAGFAWCTCNIDDETEVLYRIIVDLSNIDFPDHAMFAR
jgi:hypothetical protein